MSLKPTVSNILVHVNKQNSKTTLFSIYSEHPFILNNKRWRTVAHYVYANRLSSKEDIENVRKQETVFQAKRLCRLLNGEYNFTRDYKNMVIALAEKFSTNEIFLKRIIDTYPASFYVEDTYDHNLKNVSQKALKLVQKKLYLEYKLSETPGNFLPRELSQQDIYLLKHLFEKINHDPQTQTNKILIQEIKNVFTDNERQLQCLNFLKTRSFKKLTQSEIKIFNDIEKLFCKYDPLQNYTKSGTLIAIYFLKFIYYTFNSTEVALEKEEIYLSEFKIKFDEKVIPSAPPYFVIDNKIYNIDGVPMFCIYCNKYNFSTQYQLIKNSLEKIKDETGMFIDDTESKIYFINKLSIRDKCENIIFTLTPQYEKLNFAVRIWFRRFLENNIIDSNSFLKIKSYSFFPAGDELLSKVTFDDCLSELQLRTKTQKIISTLHQQEWNLLNQWMGCLFLTTQNNIKTLDEYFCIFEKKK